MQIIDRIIKFLGGFTKEEYSLLNIEYISQRDLVSSYRARQDSILEELKEERKERKFLQDLIFKKFGITISEDSSKEETSFQPVKTSPRRWSDLKSAMEQDDRNRVKGYSDAKVS